MGNVKYMNPLFPIYVLIVNLIEYSLYAHTSDVNGVTVINVVIYVGAAVNIRF